MDGWVMHVVGLSNVIGFASLMRSQEERMVVFILELEFCIYLIPCNDVLLFFAYTRVISCYAVSKLGKHGRNPWLGCSPLSLLAPLSFCSAPMTTKQALIYQREHSSTIYCFSPPTVVYHGSALSDCKYPDPYHGRGVDYTASRPHEISHGSSG